MDASDNVNPVQPFLTPAQVGAELSLSLSAVYNLIRSGDLKAIDVGPRSAGGRKAHYRIRRQWLDEFILARRHQPLYAPPVAPQRTRRSTGLVRTARNHLRL
jgi:hypothetical protein